MSRNFFDYDDGDFAYTISNNMAIDSDGDLLMRMGDNMAMNMVSGVCILFQVGLMMMTKFDGIMDYSCRHCFLIPPFILQQ